MLLCEAGQVVDSVCVSCKTGMMIVIVPTFLIGKSIGLSEIMHHGVWRRISAQ